MLTLALFNFGPGELLLIGIVALLIFGRRLPEVGRNLGKGIVEFKKGLAGVDEDINKQVAVQQQAPPPTPVAPAAPPVQTPQLNPPTNSVSYGSQAQQVQAPAQSSEPARHA